MLDVELQETEIREKHSTHSTLFEYRVVLTASVDHTDVITRKTVDWPRRSLGHRSLSLRTANAYQI